MLTILRSASETIGRTVLVLPTVVVLLMALSVPSARAASAMQTYVNAMQPGWNLGNTFDATGSTETSWGNPVVTQAFIQQIAAQGFKSIRIPVTWSQHTGPAPTYTVDAAWLARVKQVVDWSLGAGLYVMINMHHDSWQWVSAMPTNHDAVLAEYRAIWTQVSATFADEPSTLMFESINEQTFPNVTDATAMALQDEINSAFFDVVRKSGGKNATRPLVLAPVGTSGAQKYLDSLKSTMLRLNDSNLIATVHYYGFWPFSVNIAGDTKFVTDSVDDLTTVIDAVTNTLGVSGIPTVVGEYGLLAFDQNMAAIEHGEMLKYFETFTQYARSKNVTHMLWDNGQHFDRKAYVWRDPEKYAVIMRSLVGRSLTADTDLIFLKRGAAVADAVIALNLNGNQVVAVKDGATTLAAGTDFTLAGSTLTIRAAALSKYSSGTYGEKTVLTVEADAGPAWKLHVRCYGTPGFFNATGTTTTGLLLPAAFAGDLVSTMEAAYVNGGFPGPQSWTTYKQYNDTFIPDYTNNTFQLTSTFLKAATAGPVVLTVHFWSGQTLKFQLTVSGSSAAVDLPVVPAKPVQQAVAASDSTTRIVNLSTRGVAEAGDTAMIVGFVIGGSGAKKVQIRAVAQTLLNFGLTGVLRKPLLTLYDSKQAILATAKTQDTYAPYDAKTATCPVKPEVVAAFKAVGGFDLAANASGGKPDGTNPSGDTVMIVTLPPGAYTASITPDSDTPQLSVDSASTSGGSGIVLCELYDADDATTATTRLVNISTRGKIESGARQMFAGFVVAGNGGRRLLIRGIGPTLRDFGLGAALAASRLQLLDGANVELLSNSNWGTATWTDQAQSEFSQVGAFPLTDGSADAVILARVTPGLYNVVISSPSGTPGIGMAEIYED